MDEKCCRPFFGPKGFLTVGHCVLPKYHQGYPQDCVMQVETKPNNKDQVPDPYDTWKPSEDFFGEMDG